MRTRDVVMVVMVAAAAAPGCNKSTAPTGGISATCEVTLSGAVSGTFDCRPATTLWSSSDNTGGFTFGLTASSTRPAITAAVQWVGVPMDSTYTNADSGAAAQVIVTSSGQTWEAAIGPGTSPGGSYGLTFTSVVQNGSSAGGIGYAADGTLNATLPAVTSTGASGIVILSATF